MHDAALKDRRGNTAGKPRTLQVHDASACPDFAKFPTTWRHRPICRFNRDLLTDYMTV